MAKKKKKGLAILGAALQAGGAVLGATAKADAEAKEAKDLQKVFDDNTTSRYSGSQET